jgi:hypothetical protein
MIDLLRVFSFISLVKPPFFMVKPGWHPMVTAATKRAQRC